ncbi:MAG: SBBP repeat-containing protein, partial [Kiritimatiellae bacterium]|nr:SBBP repeat-containing protein [Kiritimatiellia bacterium]
MLAGLITSTAEAPADYKEISRESSEFKGLRPDLKAMAGNNDATSRLRARVNASYGKLPLYFIRNEGQVDRRANFYAKTRNYMLWFTENGLVFDKVLSEGKRNNKADSPELKKESRSGKFKRDISRLEFAGVNKKTLLNGVQEQEHRANYFKGNDRSKWKTAIKTFAEVQYNNIYDHIDLKVYGVENQIEYDWEVLPGGKPSDIRFRYKGVKKTEITKDGDLLVKTSFGELFHKKPVAFQEINGEKVAIAASFKMTGRDRYGIEVGAYDKTRKLIIDPLIYSTYLDGSDMDSSDCIVVDGSGNAYVTGYTDSTDFPTTAGAYDTSYNGWREGFITKINASGTALVYSTYLGGSGPDHPSSIAIDSSGNAYVTGHTSSIDFPTTVGAYDTSHNGKTYDTFITKLNASGTALVYSTYLGGSGDDYTSSITLDGSGNAYVTGSTDSNDFPATAGAYETSYIYNGWREGFITKLNASGTALVYSTYLGGNGEDWIYSIALDHSGNAYVTGGTYSTDFPTTSGAYDTSYNGGRSAAFITKLNATGTALVYSTYLEGSSYDSGYSIALDGSGNAYVTGNTYSTDFPVTPGTYGTSFNGETEGFITKLNASGTTLLYSTYLGGNGSDFIACIVIDSSGNACVTGETISTDFPVTPGAYDTIFNGGRDGFITKLNASGTALVYSTYLGGSGHDSGTGIALDGSGNAYVTGSTNSTDFPTTAGAYDTSYNGGEFGVGFIIKLNFALSSITLTSPNGGENWNSGTIHNITWSSGGTIANVNIDYSANIGSSWTSVAAGTANDGTYAWTVPAITPSANCLVRISDASNAATNDVSDSVFSISSAATETVSTPSQPSGANSGLKATSYPFTTGGSTSNLGHSIQYKFDWDDGSDSGWLAVGTTTAAHSWSAAGSYDVRAMARCAEHTTVESIWSPTLSVIITDGVTTGHYNSPAQYKVLPEVIWAPATGGGTWMSNVQVTDVSGGSQVSVYYNAASGRRGPFLLWDNSGGGALSSVKYTNLLQTIDGLDSGAFTYYGTVGAVEFISQDGSHLLQAAARTLNGNYAKTFTALSLHDANTADTSR